jgi:hypothetical protein
MIFSSNRAALLGAARFLQRYPDIAAAKVSARIEGIAMTFEVGAVGSQAIVADRLQGFAGQAHRRKARCGFDQTSQY